MVHRSLLPMLLACGLALAVPAARSAEVRDPRAGALHASAMRRLARGTPEQRQFARSELEEAARISPADRTIALALGRLYLEADMLQRARAVVDGVLARDSADADAQALMGSIWRRDWLVGAEDASRDRAIVCFARGARLEPGRPASWMAMIPLLVEAGEDDLAREAATLALRAAPGDPEAKLLLACTAQRTGDLELAGGLFRSALAKLPPAARADFDDLTPLVAPWAIAAFEDLPSGARAKYAERFWRDSDPDPVTPENEARLEFWARVEHSRALWGRSSLGPWDMRAQLYIRYGPPGFVERNPIVNPDLALEGHWLVWTYPDLGMRVWMEATNPLAAWTAPFSRAGRLALPYRDSLERHGELAPVAHGWALFRKVPPRTEPLAIACALAQFQADAGPRVLAQVEIAGAPADPMTAEWAVMDSTLEVVARSESGMAASACSPGVARAASYAASLPPGRYRLGVHVADGTGRRGVATRDFLLTDEPGGLSLSDLVVTCGPPERSVVPGSGVRLEPETGLFPGHETQLNAYFEIYHLAPEGAEAPFEYVCTVRSANADRRSWIRRTIAPQAAPAPIEMSRRETARGPVRRQFLSVPFDSRPGGTYEIEVRVRAVATGEEAVRVARFVRGD